MGVAVQPGVSIAGPPGDRDGSRRVPSRAGLGPELNTAIDSRFPLYSCGNVSEILPGCVTPLTYRLFSRGVEKAFRNVAEYLGSMPDVGTQPIVDGFFFGW